MFRGMTNSLNSKVIGFNYLETKRIGPPLNISELTDSCPTAHLRITKKAKTTGLVETK